MNGTNNTMIGLAAEAVGKEDNYAENTGYVYQYGRSGRGCLKEYGIIAESVYQGNVPY